MVILQAYSPILSVTGTINWKYIVHLNDVQNKSGLHAANRVTDTHVYFGNQKMKVCFYDDLLCVFILVLMFGSCSANFLLICVFYLNQGLPGCSGPQ